MLTPTDVHILVGLLVNIHAGAELDVELGSLVDDVIAEEPRDVDITVTSADGTQVGFAGIEVKRESRPLDVIKVEQLCAKLLHMPSLTRRAIVSASGYTVPAVRVAENQGVELFDLAPWDDSAAQLAIQLPSDLIWERILDWKSSPRFEFHAPSMPTPLSSKLRRELNVHGPSGNRRQGVTLGSICELVSRHVLAEALQKPAVSAIDEGRDIPISESLAFDDHPNVKLAHRLYEVRGVRIDGVAQWSRRKVTSEMKVLRRHGGPAIHGLAIGELTDGALIGIVVTQASQRPTIIQIDVPHRLKQKIRRMRLGQRAK